MTDNPGRFRVLTAEEILRVHPTLPFRTSCNLNWPGVELHRYGPRPVDAGGRPLESPTRSFPHLAVFLSHATTPYSSEVTIGDLKLRREVTRRCISIAPPRMPHTVRSEGTSEVTVLFLDPAVLADAALRVTGLDAPDLIPQLFIHDPLIAQLVSSFEEEVVAGGIAPRLYIESLASALGAHIVTKYSAPSLWDKRPGALNCSQVRSAVALMNERLDGDITLQDLASSACMSKYHFAKCFKLAVGVAPHQYLVRLRMEKARKLLSGDRLSIEEVANAVGYACRAHFVQQFRKTVGVTPSHYRRAR